MNDEYPVEAAEVGREIDTVDEELQQEIREFFLAFLKAIRASQFYVQGNPLLHQFVADLTDRLQALWDRLPALSLTIYENQFQWRGRPVYQAQGLHDNVAFEFYKDGIRRITFHPGAENAELQDFLDTLRLARQLKEADDDDLLTLLWHRDFTYIHYEYVDVLAEDESVESPADLLQEKLEEESAELPQLPELELTPELRSPEYQDFEPSLYFLDEEEISRLQRELRVEWEREPKRAVITALLDQFEMGDNDRRYEIVHIFRDLLPRVLADGDLVYVAYILEELRAVAGQHEDEGLPERVAELGEELSRPEVVEQIIRIMDDGAIETESEALSILFRTLRPEAMVILIRFLPSVNQPGTREQLEKTLERLAAPNPDLMRNLLASEDTRVAKEAARLAGRLEMSDLSDALAALLEGPDEEVRLAAVESLASLRSSMAGRPLVEALKDRSRDVRVAAARGLASLKFRPASEQLERHIRDRDLWSRDLTEQLAFFEAFARASGDESVRLLGRMLNGRRFLWLRYPGGLRACAARALGMLSTETAADALARAENDRDPMVRTAVHAARSE